MTDHASLVRNQKSSARNGANNSHEDQHPRKFLECSHTFRVALFVFRVRISSIRKLEDESRFHVTRASESWRISK